MVLTPARLSPDRTRREVGPLPAPQPQERRSQSRVGYALVVTLLMAVAILLRFAGLNHYPLRVHQDELSNIYDGYSLATTGADRTGSAWPVLVRGMGPGDYRPALYPYLAAVTTTFSGFSIGAGRVPAAIAGMLTVVFIFLLSRRAFGRVGGVIALVFAVFSPILIQYGRQAHEGACLPPLFAIAIVYLIYRAIENPQWQRSLRASLAWVAGAGLVVGLSASAYGAQRMTGPLFAVLGACVIVFYVGVARRSWKHSGSLLLVFTVATLVGAAPQIYAMFATPDEFFARAKTIGFNWQAGPGWWSRRIVEGYAAHFDPRLMFLSFGTYGELTVARLSVVAMPFVYVGMLVAFYKLIRRRALVMTLLLAGLIISVAPAVASKSNLGIMRASGAWAFYPVFAALGALAIGVWARSCWRRLTHADSSELISTRMADRPVVMATAVLGLLVAGNGVCNLGRYLTRPDLQGVIYQNHLVRMGEWIEEHGGEYPRVYVETPGVFAYLYVAAFSGMSPAEYQDAPREGTVTPFGWEKFQRFGRFRFTGLSAARADWEASAKDERWLYVSADGQSLSFEPGGRVERLDVPVFYTEPDRVAAGQRVPQPRSVDSRPSAGHVAGHLR